MTTAAVLLAALLLAGCARRAPEAAAKALAYPYSAAAPRVFYATASGLVDEAPAAPSAQGAAPASSAGAGGTATAGLPASRAPNASVLSADGSAICAAINGWGLALVEPSGAEKAGAAKAAAAAAATTPAAGLAYRIEQRPLPQEFSGLSTGGAWPVKDGLLIQLYRDPFTEAADEAAPASSRLLFVGPGGDRKAESVDPFGSASGPGYELFALLPSGGSWFAELRKDQAERVDLKFLALGDPLSAGANASGSDGGGIREIRRSDFEAALKPRPLSSLAGEEGAALRSALAALGKHPWLVRLRSTSGGDAWFLSAGAAEDALPVYAWAAGDRVAALRQDGWMTYADSKGGRSLTRLSPPREDASFTALAMVGELAAAAWESGSFPNLEAAGLLVYRSVAPAK